MPIMDDDPRRLRLLEEIRDAQLRMARVVERWTELLPYVRHLDGCPQDPCSCGLMEIMGEAPP